MIIAAAGNKPKRIEEFIGRVNSSDATVSVARMTSPDGELCSMKRAGRQTAGCFACHSVACSNACPTRQSTGSLGRRPTNCTLNGRPSAEKPHGTDTSGCR